MARVRLIGSEPVSVPELGGRTVEPDEIVEVPDGRFDAYVCQTQTWDSIEEPALVPEADTAADGPQPVKKAAAKLRKEG
ncbi:hypothetical protein ACN2WE_21485 [Streptomyces sp. cg28]|uniref:hypothetical protein n=1 Tax=Streptomyces sp. cg28 TaxID=3403457 RepID=UPI003B21B9E0